MALVNKRSEIIFCYDIKDANPNGDPLDSNKPRIDEETGINIVTDVRLKRTIRDYLLNYKGFNGKDKPDIFIKEVRKEDKTLKTKEDRMTDLNIKKEEDLLNHIDIRLFGATTAVKEKTITFTGPVQFQFGRSLNKIDINDMYIKGTTVMPSKEAKGQGTFTETYVVPYSFICFYGIINEVAAQETKLNEEDIKLLLEGIWEGTKNLISRSKIGQIPRLLIKVNYKNQGFYIGDINKSIKHISNKRDEELRSIDDFKIDITELSNILNKNKDNIDSIEYKIDERLKLLKNDKEAKINDLLSGKMEEIKF